MLSSTPYNGARLELGKGSVNLETAVVKALLVASGYVPDFDTHKYLSHVTHEIVGNNYGRVALANKTWSLDTDNNLATLKSDPVVFSALGGPIVARHMILFVDTGDPATSLLLCAILLDMTPQDVTINDGGAGTFTPDSVGGWLDF